MMMGVDLCGVGGYSVWNWWGWRSVLELGRLYGWKPAGTKPPTQDEGGPWDGRPWGGGYLSNDGQRVTATDARALADALDLALPDVPDGDIVAGKMGIVGTLPDGSVLRGPKPGVESSLTEAFSGEGKCRLEEFIRLCRAGEFAIW
jgi:hypothetical protein